MSGDVEVFLDDTPGEARGMLSRDGAWERLIIQRDSDPAEHRLGARCVGRVATVDPSLSAAFVDLGRGAPFGFLPLSRAAAVTAGRKVEVEVAAEPRDRKGPTLRYIGPASGEPRLLAAGPDVAARLAALAPGVVPVTGAAAIEASRDAEETALADEAVFAGAGVNLAVERTRALVAVDIDYAGAPGRDARRGKAQANQAGLTQAARLVRLKGWGGLVCIDLVGAGHDGTALAAMAKAAFAGDGPVAVGPVSRFGLLQLTIPWRDRPIESILDPDGPRALETRAIDLVRRLRLAMLSNTAAPRIIARCRPDEAAQASGLALRLGPRVQVAADPAMAAGAGRIEET